ncbi:MAG: hypothetical protein ACI395_10510 [Candidatus Cryptobacteroides sp.]
MLICTVIFGGAYLVPAAAQEKKIYLTPMVSDAIGIPEASQKTLLHKLNQMALQNGMAAQEGNFVLTASVSVIGREEVPTAPPQLAVKAEVMLYVVNLLDNIVVAENSITVRGVDSNESKAYTRAINQINPRSAQVQEFVAQAKKNIIQYYSDKAETLMAKARSLSAKGQYPEALAALDPIPEEVPAYSAVSALKDEIFFQWVETQATALIEVAKKDIALGKYEEAYESLLAVSPLSSRFSEVQELSADIDRRRVEAEKAAAEVKKLELETAKAQAEATAREKEAEIAQAEASKAQAQATLAQANAQAALSEAQMIALKGMSEQMGQLSGKAQKAAVDQSFRLASQMAGVSQAVAEAKPEQTMEEKTESLKKFLLGKMYKA